jgi:hypothetical protein
MKPGRTVCLGAQCPMAGGAPFSEKTPVNRPFSTMAIALLATLSLVLISGGTERVDAARPDASPPTRSSLRLDCMAYRIESAKLLTALEQNAGDAAKMLELIKARETASAAKRLARVQGVTSSGGELSYSNSMQVPIITVNQGQFSSQSSFGGYQKADTRLEFVCSEQGGQVSTRYSIQIESFLDTKKESSSTPPPRDRISFSGKLSAPLGAPEGFVIDADGKEGSAIVVILVVSPA